LETGWLKGLMAAAEQAPITVALLLAGLLFIESFAVVGLAIPGTWVVFFLGALVGLGLMDLPTALIAGAAGAILGDSFNYWLGYRYRDALARRWPLSRYPGMMQRGRRFFRDYGMASILLARFIGPLRSFIPVISGTMAMAPRRFAVMVVLTGVVWAPVFIIPGMLFGASLDLAAAYTSRLVVVLLVVGGIVWAVGIAVRRGYQVLANRVPWLLKRALLWLRRHPRLGRIFAPLFNPVRGEMLSVAMLALVLLAMLAGLLTVILQTLLPVSGPTLDERLRALAISYRNPAADNLWTVLATVGDWHVVAVVAVGVAVWFALRRRRLAAAHWLLAVAGVPLLGLALQAVFRWLPAAPAHLQAWGRFPDLHLAAVAGLAGAVPMLLAREIRAERRKWLYWLSALLITLVALARLGLGLAYISGVLAAVSVAFLWITGVGIGYRVRVSGFDAPRRHLVFVAVAFCVVASTELALRLPVNRAAWAAWLPAGEVAAAHWWQQGWQELPRARSALRLQPHERFNLQYAGALERLHSRLEDAGWRAYDSGRHQWWQVLNPRPDPQRVPMFRQDYRGVPAHLMMVRDTGTGRREVLRLWRSNWRLEPDGVELLLGLASQEQLATRGYWFNAWQWAGPPDRVLAALRRDLPGMHWRATGAGVRLVTPSDELARAPR